MPRPFIMVEMGCLSGKSVSLGKSSNVFGVALEHYHEDDLAFEIEKTEGRGSTGCSE
jgi:hypothetical protein